MDDKKKEITQSNDSKKINFVDLLIKPLTIILTVVSAGILNYEFELITPEWFSNADSKYDFFSIDLDAKPFVTDEINSFLNNNDEIAVYFDTDSNNVDFTLSEYKEGKTPVIFINELRSLIHPDNFNCNLDNPAKDEIKNNKNWIPPELESNIKSVDLLDSLNQTILYYPGRSSAYLVNSYSVLREKNGDFVEADTSLVPIGATLFASNTSVEFIDTESNSFITNYDCKKYYNAAISTGVGGKRRRIKGNAERVAGAENSLFVAMGYINSPLKYIMSPYSISISSDIKNSNRFDYLMALLSQARNVFPNDSIKVKSYSQIVMFWSSNTGSKSIGSVANIDAKSNLFSIVDVKVNGSVDVKRTNNYRTFRTYFVKRPADLNESIFTISEIQDKAKDYFSSIELTQPIYWYNNDLNVSVDIKREYCNQSLDWDVVDEGYSILNIFYDAAIESCNIIIEEESSESLEEITLQLKLLDMDLTRNLRIPEI